MLDKGNIFRKGISSSASTTSTPVEMITSVSLSKLQLEDSRPMFQVRCPEGSQVHGRELKETSSRRTSSRSVIKRFHRLPIFRRAATKSASKTGKKDIPRLGTPECPRDCSESPETSEKNFLQKFWVGPLIGQGAFASVYAGFQLNDSTPVSVKVIPKYSVDTFEKVGGKEIPLEVHLHRFLDHPNVIKLYELYEGAETYVMVMERPRLHRDLLDYVSERQYLPDLEAKAIFCQVVEGLLHCWSQGVFFQDLREENILLDVQSFCVKLLDTGSLSRLKGRLYSQYEGSRAYCPPEWLRFRRYMAEPASVWALGILLHVMLTGSVPFTSDVEIVRCNLNLPARINYDVTDLIRKMLACQPAHRPTLLEVKAHPWVQTHQPYHEFLRSCRRERSSSNTSSSSSSSGPSSRSRLFAWIRKERGQQV